MSFWKKINHLVQNPFRTSIKTQPVPISQLQTWFTQHLRDIEKQRRSFKSKKSFFASHTKHLPRFEDEYHHALSSFLFIERERITNAVSDITLVHKSINPSLPLDKIFILNKELLTHYESLNIAIRNHPNSTQLLILNQRLETLRITSRLLDQFSIKQGLGMYLSLQRRREELETTSQLLQRLRQQQTNLEIQIKENNEKTQERNQEQEQLTHDPLFTAATQFEATKTQLAQQQALLEHEILTFFSPLLPFFANYNQKYPQDQLVEDYYTNPITALAHDETLAINHRCDHIYALLKQSQTAQETQLVVATHLDAIEAGHLVDLQHRLLQNKQEQDQLALPGLTKDFLMRYKEIEYKIDHFTTQLQRLQSEKAQLAERHKSIQQSLQSQVKAIEELTLAAFQVELKIENPETKNFL